MQGKVVSEAAAKGRAVSQRVAVDLAHACFATGNVPQVKT